MTEAKWTAKLCKELTLAGAVVVPIVGTTGGGGWPDRAIWHRLWQGFAEFKGESTKLQRRQALCLDSLDSRSPGTAVVLRYPGICENPYGGIAFEFETATELLKKLAARELSLKGDHDSQPH